MPEHDGNKREGRVRQFAINTVITLVALAVALLLAEAAAQVYVYKIAKHGKLFRPDQVLGWALLPDLDLIRNNHDGEPWRIVTDRDGIRGPAAWPENGGRRMLILGDSFAFGEGVDIEHRFDTLVTRQMTGLSAINLGVMGYGTDQQAIRLRTWSDRLRAGDILLVLTYSNDFMDIASSRHSGRSKPWFEAKGGTLVEHKPDIGLIEIVRDRSYLLAKLAVVFNVNDEGAYQDRLARAGALYEQIVMQEMSGLMKRGVQVVIAHHGDAVFELPFDVDAVFASVCAKVTGCIALDRAISAHPREEMFLSDGHWAIGGHKVAAEVIARHLQSEFQAAPAGTAEAPATTAQ